MPGNGRQGEGQRWGWAITAAVFGCNILCVGYFRAFGVFFVEIIDTFHTSSSVTSLIFGVQNAVFCVTALLVHNVLLQLVTVRTSAVLGGLVMATGMMLATFANSIASLIVCLSVLVGMGNAMTYGPGLVLLGQYFERRRALAIALANTGSSVGSMTLPLLATHLLQRYGLHGAWLLYGAVTLHLCVFANLYRPLQHNDQEQRSEDVEDVKDQPVDLDGELGEDVRSRERTCESEKVQLLYSKCDRSKSAENVQGLSGTGGDESDKALLGVNDHKVIADQHGSTGTPVWNNHGDEDHNSEHFPGERCDATHCKHGLVHNSEDTSSHAQNRTHEFSLTRRYMSRLTAEEGGAKAFFSTGNMYARDGLGSGGDDGDEDLGKRSLTLGDLRPSPRHHRSSGSVRSVSSVLKRTLGSIAMHASHPHLMIQTNSYKHLDHEEIIFVSEDEDEKEEEVEETKNEQREAKTNNFVGRFCDLDLLRKPLFWLVQAYVCVGVVAASGAGAYLPSLCRERGLSGDDTAVVLTSWGAVNLLGRLLTGLLADRRWLRPARLSALAFLVIGSLFQLLPFLPPQSFAAMMAVAVVYGLFEGAYFTMLPIIIIEFVGLRNFSRTFGFAQLSQGFFGTLIYPVLGILRDITGDYHATFHCLGACALAASALLMLESAVRAMKETPPKNNNVA
ncbi:uncharacterized protein [Littorina saxatilis]|uniref:Major facilitator superfamily (MFS) profile domain-containing protein n=1 Tax=Littorina saxatilis TaxID=31220 RepID=A0AAN9BFF5_9CAEN